MDTETNRNALHRQPFQSFTLRLVDGRGFYIPHPDFVAVSRRAVAVISAQNESASILEPLLIISRETGSGSGAVEEPQTTS